MATSYLSPGVYVEETDTGNKPIEGVSTSTAGVVGVTERGPANVPTLITSFGDYRRIFWLSLAATVLPLVMCLFVLPHRRSTASGQPVDWWGSALLGSTLVLVLLIDVRTFDGLACCLPRSRSNRFGTPSWSRIPHSSNVRLRAPNLSRRGTALAGNLPFAPWVRSIRAN